MRLWKSIFSFAIAAAVSSLLGLTGEVQAQEEEVFPAESKSTEPEQVENEGQPTEPVPATVKVKPSIGELRLGFLPFFSVEKAIGKKGEKAIDGWLKSVVKDQLDREDRQALKAEWLKAKKIDDEVFEDLPTSRARQVAELLEPIAKDFNVDGILATWARSRDAGFELIVLFYLPNRIQYEELILTANFERSALETSAKGGFAPQPTKDLMGELLDRNLRRISPQAPAHSPPVEQISDPTASENSSEKSDEDNTSSIGEGSSGGQSSVAVLKFSREFQAEEGAFSSFATDPSSIDFRGITTNWLERNLGRQRVVEASDPQAITFNQIEAPVIDLDPDADPKAREKALFAQAGTGVDALILGHVRDEGKKKARTFKSMSVC